MKWLQANPLGMALAATSGVLALLALVMALLWSLPVAKQIDESGSENIAGIDSIVVADEIGPLQQYEIINQKPVFNESRLPDIEDADEELPEDEVAPDIAIADAPNVKLTGIVIMPGMKLASLTPADTNIETVMAYEGDSLTGEFVGWQVSTVNPRNVVLEARDGRTLELALEVHDAKIQEPPKPVAPASEATAKTTDPGKPPGAAATAAAEDEEEPLSRAEQIRQRIAERREELRLQQEQQTQQRTNRVRMAPKTNAYQAAIQAKIGNEPKDKNPDDKDDG